MNGEPLKHYFSVRWTWWAKYELNELQEALKDFDLTPRSTPYSPLSFLTVPIILEAKADTLYVSLSKLRAILFQKKGNGGPFTEKDRSLKEIVFKLYPKWRSTPISISAPLEQSVNDE